MKFKLWEPLERFFNSHKGRTVFKLAQLIIGTWIGTISFARYVRNHDKEIVHKENEYLKIKLSEERERCDSLQRMDLINWIKIKSLEKQIEIEK